MHSNLDPQELLPLTSAAFQILMALADRERHGYAIMQEIDRATSSQVRLGPGTLYGNIKRLLRRGLIEETTKRPDPALDDERRRYYRLTRFGRDVARAEAERLESLVAEARQRKLLPSPETS